MDNKDIDFIHKQYSEYYNDLYDCKDYMLIGSYKVFIPYYKVNMKMCYAAEENLNIIEEFICKCIDRGINLMEEIQSILALENDIYQFTVNELSDKGYLCFNGNSVFFTEEGIKLYKRHAKLEKKEKNIVWYYDGLSNEFSNDFFDREEIHSYQKYKEVKNKNNCLFIMPKSVPVYQDDKQHADLTQAVIKYYNNKREENENIISIYSFEITKDRYLLYHEYLIMMFKNKENKYKVLAYDPCGINDIDQRVTKSLISKYDDDKLLDIITSESPKAKEEIVLALKNYSNDAYYDNFKRLKNDNATESKESFKIEYMMNYDIRMKFLSFLKNAEESLYIISPWMNSYIINKEFINDIENLLKKGVKIRIKYGISSKENMNDEPRNMRTEELAKKLMDIGSSYGDLLKVEHDQTHEKICICDTKHYINGSFNFLSYSAENNEYFRNEGSTYIENKEFIHRFIKDRFNEEI